MYLNFFGLKKEPFHITPDPEFLFLSPSHKEALGAIIYGIEKRKGFVSIVGEVGTGKTTIVRSYLERSDREKVKVIYVFSPNMPFSELLRTVLKGLGVEPEGSDVLALIQQLQEILIDSYRRDLSIVLIIDEAQNMSVESLEKLRMLSNLETAKDKLMQIVLVGQPELERKLNLDELRQLKQRLAIRATITPLTSEESLQYVQHRLKLAGAQTSDIFTPRALNRLIKHSRGVPRVLNILCDNSLIAGFGYQQKQVTLKIVRRVISDYEKRSRSGFKLAASLVLGALAGLLALAGVYYGNPSTADESVVAAPVQQEGVEASRGPDAAVARSVGSEVQASSVETARLPVAPEDQNKAVVPRPEAFGTVESGQRSLAEPHASAQSEKREPEVSIRHEDIATIVALLLKDGEGNSRTIDMDALQRLVSREAPSARGPQKLPDQAYPVFRVVKKGDYLTKLCVEVYGFTSERLVGWVWSNNPWLKDANLLEIGDVVVFPAPYANGRAL